MVNAFLSGPEFSLLGCAMPHIAPHAQRRVPLGLAPADGYQHARTRVPGLLQRGRIPPLIPAAEGRLTARRHIRGPPRAGPTLPRRPSNQALHLTVMTVMLTDATAS